MPFKLWHLWLKRMCFYPLEPQSVCYRVEISKYLFGARRRIFCKRTFTYLVTLLCLFQEEILSWGYGFRPGEMRGCSINQ